MVEPVIQVKAVRDDPNDDHVVSCAIAAGAEAFITGDKHLLRMSSYEGIKMLRLGSFCGAVRARAERSIGRKHHVRQRRMDRSPSAIDTAPICNRRVANRRLARDNRSCWVENGGQQLDLLQ